MSVEDDFDESIRLLEALYHEPIVPAARAEPRRTLALLAALDNPHHQFRSVHIAGTTGKGSTTTMVGRILEEAGFRTGYFRSPHLQSYRERIAVGSAEIDAESWVKTFQTVWEVVKRMRSNALPDYDLGRPSLFDVTFAMAALYFRDSGVEWGAVETGLGGRLDPTNVLAPDVAVITNVSLEHTQVLGRTVEQIASEKAAIIKQGSNAVTAADDPAALAVVESRAREVGVPLLRVGLDVRVTTQHADARMQRIRLESGDHVLEVSLPLGGLFQATNAATAYAVAVALRNRHLAIKDGAVVRGLESTTVPGRFEVVRGEPLVVVDGAHNPAGAAVLAETLQAVRRGRPITVLFASMRDKDFRRMAKELEPLAESVVLTVAPGTDRAADVKSLQSAFSGQPDLVLEPDAETAMNLALAKTPSNGMLVVTGSLYLVGYARSRLLATMAATQ